MLFLADEVEGEVVEESVASGYQLNAIDEMFNFGFIQQIESRGLQIFLIKAMEVLAVLIILFILCKIVDIITKTIKRRMEKKGRDKTVTKTVYHLTNKGIKVLLIIIAVGCLGIDTTSIVGLFTAAGLGIGLAVQGALSNFAGGFLILIMRPFRVDDFIECQGVMGRVDDIHLFYTMLVTVDNKEVMIPNGALIGGNVINYSKLPTRRVDIDFNVDYKADFMKAEEIIKEVASNHELVLKDPAPFARVTEFGESSLKVTCRVWVKGDDYWGVRFDLIEQGYEALKENGIKVPFKQLEISYRDALQAEKEGK